MQRIPNGLGFLIGLELELKIVRLPSPFNFTLPGLRFKSGDYSG